MAIFGSKQKPSSHNAALLDNAKRAFATRGNPLDSGVISRAFSAESLDATEREKLDGAVQDLETTLRLRNLRTLSLTKTNVMQHLPLLLLRAPVNACNNKQLKFLHWVKMIA